MTLLAATEPVHELHHSGMGIASFVIGIAIGIYEFVLVVILGTLEASTPGGLSEEAPVTIFLGLLVVGGVMVALVGMGLGIAGVLQRDHKRLFSVLGLVFNGLTVLAVLALVILGSAMEGGG